MAFFIGLYGIKTSDAVDDALSLAKCVTSAAGLDLKHYTDLASSLSDGLAQILNRGERVPKLGVRQVFNTDNEHGLMDMYLAFLNAQSGAVDANNLVVKDGRLQLCGSDGSVEPYVDHDYCLTKIIFRNTRGDYTQLPYYKFVKQARQLLLDGQNERAKWIEIEAMKAIDASPDLIDAHKTDLMMIHKGELEQLRTGSAAFRREGVRGSGIAVKNESDSDAKLVMQRIARHAKSATMTTMLRGLERNWDDFSAVLAADTAMPLKDADINRKIQSLRRFDFSRVGSNEFVYAMIKDALAS